MNSDDSNDDQPAIDSIPEDNSNTLEDAEGENTPESDVSEIRKVSLKIPQHFKVIVLK